MGGYCLFVALQDIDGVAVDGFGGNEESAHAGAHFDNSRSHLMWAFGARREKFDLPERPEHVTGEHLRTAVLKAMARGWDERFLALVRLADVHTINAIAIRTSISVTPWQTERITLLGGAASHSHPRGSVARDGHPPFSEARNLARHRVHRRGRTSPRDPRRRTGH
jgi:hypothetical protein